MINYRTWRNAFILYSNYENVADVEREVWDKWLKGVLGKAFYKKTANIKDLYFRQTTFTKIKLY